MVNGSKAEYVRYCGDGYADVVMEDDFEEVMVRECTLRKVQDAKADATKV